MQTHLSSSPVREAHLRQVRGRQSRVCRPLRIQIGSGVRKTFRDKEEKTKQGFVCYEVDVEWSNSELVLSEGTMRLC